MNLEKCFLTAGSDEASQPINNHLECVEMLAESEQTLSLARHDIFTNSVRWRNVVCTRRPGLYHKMSTSLISIMVARTNIGISTYAWAETIIALLSVPYLLNIEKQDDAYSRPLTLDITISTSKRRRKNLIFFCSCLGLFLCLCWGRLRHRYTCACAYVVVKKKTKNKKNRLYVYAAKFLR